MSQDRSQSTATSSTFASQGSIERHGRLPKAPRALSTGALRKTTTHHLNDHQRLYHQGA
jgi:hypothetical protein